jgi:hypothetical protein
VRVFVFRFEEMRIIKEQEAEEIAGTTVRKSDKPE